MYVTDKLFNKVLEHADKPTQFALRLAYLTGQRPADVLKMRTTDISDGYLHLKQNKTQEKVRVHITGDLKTLLEEIQDYKNSFSIIIMHLLVNDDGKALTTGTLRGKIRPHKASSRSDKKIFQLRDLRAKAATDIDDASNIKEAQILLSHTSPVMTERYVRPRLGRKASPAKQLRNCSAKMDKV